MGRKGHKSRELGNNKCQVVETNGTGVMGCHEIKTVTNKSSFNDDDRVTSLCRLAQGSCYTMNRGTNSNYYQQQPRHPPAALEEDECFICRGHGHWARHCTSLPLEFLCANPPQCFRCSGYGHYARCCPSVLWNVGGSRLRSTAHAAIIPSRNISFPQYLISTPWDAPLYYCKR